MVLFGAFSAGIYAFFAFIAITYVTLLVAVVLLTTSFLFVSSAQNGLTSMMGQQHVMSSQISTVWNIFGSVPVLVAFLVGGVLSDKLEGRNADQAARILVLIGGAIMALVALYSTSKPKSVFDNVRIERGATADPNGSQATSEPLAGLSGLVHLDVVELRTRRADSTAILSSGHPPG
jgi:Na+/melibiose symporter-like transporter